MTGERLCSATPTPAEIAEAKDRIVAVLHAHGAQICGELEKRCDLGQPVRFRAVAELVKAKKVRVMSGAVLRQYTKRGATFVFLPGCPPVPERYPERVGLPKRLDW